MRKSYLIYITSILIIINLVLSIMLYKVKNTFKDFQFLYFQNKIKYDEAVETITSYKERVINVNLISGHQLQESLEVLDTNNNAISLVNLLSNTNAKTIFRMHGSYESAKNDYYLRIIKKIKDGNSFDNIIIFTSNNDFKELKSCYKKYGIPVYYIPEVPHIKYDKYKQSYMFTFDRSFIVKNGYIPLINDLDQLEEYFKILVSY